MTGCNKRFNIRITPKTRTVLILTGSIFVAAIIALYLTSPLIAKRAIRQKIKEVENERNVAIQIGDLSVKPTSNFGTFNIGIHDLVVCDKQAEVAFLQAPKLNAKVQALKAFRRATILRSLESKQISMHLVKQGSSTNYAFLKSQSEGAKTERDYRKTLTGLIEKVGDIAPQRLDIDRMTVVTDIDSVHVRYVLRGLNLRGGKGTGKMSIQQQGESAEQWTIACAIDSKRQTYDGVLERTGADTLTGALPFLRHLNKFDVQLHQAHGRFTMGESGKKGTHCTLSGSIRNLQCQHHYLADEPVRIDSLGGNLDLIVRAKSIALDSTSTIRLNRATLHPHIEYVNDKSKHIILKINEKDRETEPLFASLPRHLFQIIPNMRIEGKMDFSCLLDCDFGNLDSLKFDFNFRNQERSVRITEGLGEITRFNEQFEYTFYDHGEPVRNLWVGPNNPYFCPSYQIPDLLKQAILASEDGAFFVHNGFCKSAMQQALIDDIKAGKMRRGGSTITMQLVKNLFLSRKKVLTRKFEEMLLVWMIEDQHLISKERLFEIYVNIIEWAPGVIGIGEASEFYFHKRPHELTMPECIYLATLIRAPKHYASTLNPDGSVTDVKRSELEFVADRMVTREFMTEAQRANFDSNVKTVIRRSEN